MPAAIRYFHVDVFAAAPLCGNGLSVFVGCDGCSDALLQQLAREMRQFESVFLSEVGPAGARARIFTVQEELAFAGHPLLGAAAVLQRLQPDAMAREWTLQLVRRSVRITTEPRRGGAVFAEMNQGPAQFGKALETTACADLLAALQLSPQDLVTGLPLQVVSTGLPYLIVPVQSDALARAAIRGDLTPLLAALGADFVYLLDPAVPEGRTWDNGGEVEDVATGSAAGPAAAFLQAYSPGLALPLRLQQGRHAGRPSALGVRRSAGAEWLVSGEVWPVLDGTLDAAVLRREAGADPA